MLGALVYNYLVLTASFNYFGAKFKLHVYNYVGLTFLLEFVTNIKYDRTLWFEQTYFNVMTAKW